jgi:hypothetical protein
MPNGELLAKALVIPSNLFVDRWAARTEHGCLLEHDLTLQLHFSFEMGAACFGLVSSSPE